MKRSQAPSKALSSRVASSISVEEQPLFTPGSSQLSGMNSYRQNSPQITNIRQSRQSPRLVEKQKDAENSIDIISSIRAGTQTQLFTDVEMEILQGMSDDEIYENLTLDPKKVFKKPNKKGKAIIEYYIEVMNSVIF